MNIAVVFFFSPQSNTECMDTAISYDDHPPSR